MEDQPDDIPRQKWANTKSYCKANFELQENQVYRKAKEQKGVQYKPCYVACYSDTFDMICRIHRGLGHARKCSWIIICILLTNFQELTLLLTRSKSFGIVSFKTTLSKF
jgi:hypothetical protein